jgi:predicted HTH transcriptional regulator
MLGVPLFNKELTSLTEADINSLIDSRDAEAKLIEYKAKLPDFDAPHLGRDEIMREFLADVSSFANASGGDIVYGVKAVKGVPTDINGLLLGDVDGMILRMAELVRSHIRPRFTFDVHPIRLSDSSKGVVLVLRVRKGLLGPHQITYNGYYQFYSRNTAGKYRLDVDELRTLFAVSATSAERIRGFRAERLSNVAAGETPVPLEEGPKLSCTLCLYKPSTWLPGSTCPYSKSLQTQD